MANDLLFTQLQAALGPGLPIQRELSGGGMSRVFVARDTQLDRDVVVKVLEPELAQELSVERFAREIALAAALQHANIVPLLAAGATADGVPYYLMPFVDGESLRDILDTRGALPVADVPFILRDVVRALAAAHARGVVHRDIKPGNVMISGGAALVTDFGIAKAMTYARETAADGNDDGSLTRMGTSLGTPNYMAPEQGAGDPNTDHRADIYALGAMTYELLAGAPPFGTRPAHAQLIAHLSEIPTPLAERRPETPGYLADLVMTCLEKDPEKRPQSAQAILDILSGQSTAAHHTAKVDRAELTASGRASRRWPWLVALGVACIGGGAFAYNRMHNAPLHPDGTLLAVMPFTVRESSLTVWREGLVDVLSRSLDGAGNLRIVSPSASINSSPERADESTAAELAATLGAGLVLFGDLGTIGPDSVHLRAALYDVGLQRTRADFDVRGEAARLDALADSLAIRVLRELSASGTLAGGKLSSIGTSSLGALKAFVDGQRMYRIGRVDSARAAFGKAIAADTTFSLAWRGLAATYIRMGLENDPAAQQALAQAIRFKAGRSPRDSLLLTADSLRLATSQSFRQPNGALGELAPLRALFTTLQEATRRYPDDAELWLELGDAGYHFGEFAVPAVTTALADFERAIKLDSSLLVPYFHANAIASQTGNRDRMRRYTRRIGTLVGGEAGPVYTLMADILDSAPRIGVTAEDRLKQFPVAYRYFVLQTLMEVNDSLVPVEALVTLALKHAGDNASREQTSAMNTVVASALGIRGRFIEAAKIGGPLPLALRAQLATVGAGSTDEILAEARQDFRRDPMTVVSLIPFLTRAGDTAMLRELTVAMKARDAEAIGTNPRDQYLRYAPMAEAGWQLARGDSAAAVATLLEPSLLSCGFVPCSAFQLAQLLVAGGRDREAARVLDRWLPSTSAQALHPLAALLRGQIAERLNDRERAIAMFEVVVTRWGRGDETVRAFVDEARKGLQRLGAAA